MCLSLRAQIELGIHWFLWIATQLTVWMISAIHSVRTRLRVMPLLVKFAYRGVDFARIIVRAFMGNLFFFILDFSELSRLNVFRDLNLDMFIVCVGLNNRICESVN